MGELLSLCLRLGFTAFGGPAAHIAMLREEVVQKRGWLSEQHFLDLLGATNLIPGPNSTEMVIHVGYLRAGIPGLLVAGIAFISPAMLMVLVLAWLYVQYGSTPQSGGLFYGVKPVVIVIIFQALWHLSRTASKNIWFLILGALVLALYLVGINEIFLLFGSALGIMLFVNAKRLGGKKLALGFVPLGITSGLVASTFSLGLMFLIFLKIGAVLYGSGYVLFAFLHAEFITRLGWLTDQQLIDAIAVGQFTPGPVFTAATFIGYLLGGVPGALLATLGIFLPSFVFVGLSARWVPRLRESVWASSFLDGVNIAAIGLMAAVTWQLSRAAFVDAYTVLIAIAGAILLFRFKVNTFWLIAGGAMLGLLISLVR